MIQEFLNFLPKSICEILINKGTHSFEEALVLGENNGYRNADSTWLEKNDLVVKQVIEAIADLTKTPIENQESPNLIRYKVGGEYKMHHDYFDAGQPYTDQEFARGGQRIKTALIYLNDNYEGGETNFPNYNLVIRPKVGKLLVWDNVKPDGTVDVDSFHAGLPVRNGLKFILAVWIRANSFE